MPDKNARQDPTEGVSEVLVDLDRLDSMSQEELAATVLRLLDYIAAEREAGGRALPPFQPKPGMAVRHGMLRRITVATDRIKTTIAEACADLDRFVQVRFEGEDDWKPHPAVRELRDAEKRFYDAIQAALFPPAPEGK